MSSELGRWTRRDPLEYADGSSTYQYASSMPTVKVDPYGLCALQTWPPEGWDTGGWWDLPFGPIDDCAGSVQLISVGGASISTRVESDGSSSGGCLEGCKFEFLLELDIQSSNGNIGNGKNWRGQRFFGGVHGPSNPNARDGKVGAGASWDVPNGSGSGKLKVRKKDQDGSEKIVDMPKGHSGSRVGLEVSAHVSCNESTRIVVTAAAANPSLNSILIVTLHCGRCNLLGPPLYQSPNFCEGPAPHCPSLPSFQ